VEGERDDVTHCNLWSEVVSNVTLRERVFDEKGNCCFKRKCQESALSATAMKNTAEERGTHLHLTYGGEHSRIVVSTWRNLKGT